MNAGVPPLEQLYASLNNRGNTSINALVTTISAKVRALIETAGRLRDKIQQLAGRPNVSDDMIRQILERVEAFKTRIRESLGRLNGQEATQLGTAMGELEQALDQLLNRGGAAPGGGNGAAPGGGNGAAPGGGNGAAPGGGNGGGAAPARAPAPAASNLQARIQALYARPPIDTPQLPLGGQLPPAGVPLAPRVMAPQGLAPQGLAPQGLAPQGLAPQAPAAPALAAPFQPVVGLNAAQLAAVRAAAGLGSGPPPIAPIYVPRAHLEPFLAGQAQPASASASSSAFAPPNANTFALGGPAAQAENANAYALGGTAPASASASAAPSGDASGTLNATAVYLLKQPWLAELLIQNFAPEVKAIIQPGVSSMLTKLSGIINSDTNKAGRLLDLANLIRRGEAVGRGELQILLRAIPEIVSMGAQNLPNATNYGTLKATYLRIARRPKANNRNQLNVTNANTSGVKDNRELILQGLTALYPNLGDLTRHNLNEYDTIKLLTILLFRDFVLYAAAQARGQPTDAVPAELGGDGLGNAFPIGAPGLEAPVQANALALGAAAAARAPAPAPAPQYQLHPAAARYAAAQAQLPLARSPQGALPLQNQGAAPAPLAILNQGVAASPAAGPNREISEGDLNSIKRVIESRSTLTKTKITPGSVLGLLTPLRTQDPVSKKNLDVAKNQVLALLIDKVQEGKKDVPLEELLTNPDSKTRTYLGLLDYVSALDTSDDGNRKNQVAILLYILRDMGEPGSANNKNEYVANSNMANAKKAISNATKKYTLTSPYNAKGGARKTRCGCGLKFGGRRTRRVRPRKTRKSRR